MELYKYAGEKKVRIFYIEAIQLPIVYNKYGDHDPDGLLYVLEEDTERYLYGNRRFLPQGTGGIIIKAAAEADYLPEDL